MLLASLITFGLMLLLLTRDGGVVQLRTGDVLRQECAAGGDSTDVCYAVVVENSGSTSGAAVCEVTDPEGGVARFADGFTQVVVERLGPEERATVMLLVRPDGSDTAPGLPGVECRPA
jgi:hypothetical protein